MLGGTAFASFAIVNAQQPEPTPAPDAPVRLEYTVPSECAGQTQFVERVRVRSERIQFEPLAKNSLTLTIEGKGSNWTGRVSFMDAERQSVSREITARSCDEVIDGLALVTVMVLDPEAIQQDANGNQAPTQLSATSPAPSVPSARPQPSPHLIAHEPAALPSSCELGADAASAGIVGPAPGLMWGYGISAQFSWIRQSPLSPHIRASFLHFSRDAYLARGGTASFELNDLSLSLCPYEARANGFHLRPCVAGTYGRLSAAGTRTFVPVTETHTWAEADFQIETVWNPAHHLELFLAPTMGLALRRYSFGFLPYVFHEVPKVILSGTAGVGLQFE